MRTGAIITMLICLAACSPKDEEEKRAPGKSHVIETYGKTSDDIFQVSRMVELETTSESLIAFPFDLCVSGEEIFVASRNSEIKVFNLEGKFRRSIGRLGDGPGEYRSVASLFPHGITDIGIYDWSNLRLTVFSREGEYRMSAVLGMPGMEGVRSVLFIDGHYYIHAPSSPAQNYHIVRMDSNFAVSGSYVKAERRYAGYQDRFLFNGGIVPDRVRGCIYEADSYFHGIRSIKLETGAVTELEFEPPSFYVPLPDLATPTSMEEAMSLFQTGTNVYDIFLVAGHYVMLEYHLSLGQGRVKVVYLLYDLNSGRCLAVPAGKAHPSYADGDHLYALIYNTGDSRQEHSMASNPTLIVYTLSPGNL